MMKRLLAACIAIGLLTASLSAQQKPAAPRPAQAKPEPIPKPEPTPKPEPPPSPADVRQRNVSIEVTIADQAGSGEAVKKVVTMIVTDRRMGSVRSGGSVVATSNGAAGASVTMVERRDVTLNVDANPVVQGDGSVLLSLTLEYIPRPEGPENTGAEAKLNQRMTVTLESGKAMVISRAADPAGNRKINVEVTATVMK
jgi:glucose/arabinose dehydrogenase